MPASIPTYIVAIVIFSLPVFLIRSQRKNNLDFLLISCLSFSAFLFFCGIEYYKADFYQPIDIISEGGYTPLASAHLLTLGTFFTMAFIALLLIWIKEKQLPPIVFVLLSSFILIGIVLSSITLIQVLINNEHNRTFLFMCMPVVFIATALTIMLRVIKLEANEAAVRRYSNPTISFLNALAAKVQLLPTATVILMLPIFWIVVLVLTLFGQNSHSITDVFTETSTWYFSHKTHPPYLDHRGHYLCTVAAYGNSKLVKPLLLGHRHGQVIIVNRQLQIANAFEGLLQHYLPTMHKLIRNFYDKYGYSLSQKISTPVLSNIVYCLMKPLEYFFLIVLYATYSKPESEIRKQYSISTY